MSKIISSNRQNCRQCYGCIRECPAKAIKIINGQATIIAERCLTCGHCLQVCTQGTKSYESHLSRTEALLSGTAPVVAMLAPSFPAEYIGVTAGQLAATLRQLGFARVVEVAAGADLVSLAYKDFLASHQGGPWISSCCPAVNALVCKYFPDLVPNLIPIVSPMTATAMAVKALYGEATKTVYIGPCIAKKAEAGDPYAAVSIEAVLTFRELNTLLAKKNLDPAQQTAEEPFSAPLVCHGRGYGLPGGLIHTIGLDGNPFDTHSIVAAGQSEVIDVLTAMEHQQLNITIFEGLLCSGCYNGPGISPSASLPPTRQQAMAAYCRQKVAGDPEALEDLYSRLDLSCIFSPDDHRLVTPNEDALSIILAHSNKFSPADELNCGACGYKTCRERAIAAYWNLSEEATCLPYMAAVAEQLSSEHETLLTNNGKH